ncbi:MAG: shikimate dehydrogenase [Bacteroidota bacterium]
MTISEFLHTDQAKAPHYLLIGSPVSHSVSPVMHNTALQHYGMSASYHAVAVPMAELPTLIAHTNSPSFLGANITIPHKETLLDVMDSFSPEALEIGAVNTIVKSNGKLVGNNTDAYGFSVPIEAYADDLAGERVILFGTGGATKAIMYALREFGVTEIVLVSRKPGHYQTPSDDVIFCGYDNWMAYEDEAVMIVNATPLGMSPNTAASPVQDAEIAALSGKICYDIVYNPRETTFLKQAQKAGAERTIGGLDMLIFQGAKAFELWTGKEFPTGLVSMRLNEYFPA